MSEDQSGQQHVIVVGPDGQPVAVPAEAVTRAEEADDDDLRELTDLVEQPAKGMRIGSMLRQLLEEGKAAPLDRASRNVLKEIPPLHHRSTATVLMKSRVRRTRSPRAPSPRISSRSSSGFRCRSPRSPPRP